MKRSLIPVALLSLALLVSCKSRDDAAKSTATTEKAATAATPTDEVYAASAALRIVDAGKRSVVAKIDLKRAIRTIEFSADGRTAFVAASDGVRVVDADRREVVAKLTDHPARDLELDEAAGRLFVLEHDVIVRADGVRDILPFSLVSFDLKSGAAIGSEEIGQRILWARPSTGPKLSGVYLNEAGELYLAAPGKKLSEGKLLEATQAGKATFRIREYTTVSGDKVYFPAEGALSSILELDLTTGALAQHDLALPLQLRGLHVTGKVLLVNAVDRLLRLDLESKKVIGSVELGLHATGLSLSSDGRFAYMAQTIDGTGGAIVMLALDPLLVVGKIHLDDISPWALAVRPRTAFALAP